MVSMVMMPKGVRLIGSLRAPPKQKDSRLLVKEERRKGFLGFKEQHLEPITKKRLFSSTGYGEIHI